jgi:hypothetical protein
VSKKRRSEGGAPRDAAARPAARADTPAVARADGDVAADGDGVDVHDDNAAGNVAGAVDVDAAPARDWVAPPVVHKQPKHKADRRALLAPTLGAVDALNVDSMVCAWCTDVRPLGGALGMIDWRLCGRVSRLLERGTFAGAVDERVLMPTHGRIPPPRLFLYGCGASTTLSSTLATRVAAMARMAQKAGARRVALSLPEPAAHGHDAIVDVVHAEFAAVDVDVVVFGPDPFPP